MYLSRRMPAPWRRSAAAIAAAGVVACGGTRIQAAEPYRWATPALGNEFSRIAPSRVAYGASYFATQDGAKSRLRFDFEGPMGLPVCGSLQHVVAWNSYGTREGYVAALWVPELLQWRDLTVALSGFVSNVPFAATAPTVFERSQLEPWQSTPACGHSNSWMNPLAGMWDAVPKDCWCVSYSYSESGPWGSRGYQVMAYW